MTTAPDIQMVTISVADMNRSLAFYRDLLGFKEIGEGSFLQGSTARLLDTGNGHVLRLVYADLPDMPHRVSDRPAPINVIKSQKFSYDIVTRFSTHAGGDILQADAEE